MCSTIATVTCSTSRFTRGDTTVSWLSAATVHCQQTSFRNQVGTGVVLTAMVAAPDGRWLATAGDDHKIRIVRTSDLVTTQTLTGHRDRIRSLAFDPASEYLVSVGNDGQLIVYDCKQSFQAVRRLVGKPALACVTFSRRDQRIAAVGFADNVLITRPMDGRGVQFDCPRSDLRAVAFRDDDRLLAVGGRGGNLMLLDPHDGRSLADSLLHRGRIHAIGFHRESNQLITVGEDGAAVVYDSQSQQALHRIQVTSGQLFSIAILNSQSVAVAGSDNRIRILNTDEGIVIRELDEHIGSIAALASVGGLLFSAGFDATLRRWSTAVDGTSSERIAESDPIKDR